ncbi:MAG: polymer-forming cytoskeletal protein [Bdellovibrionales bacterium]
MFHRPKPETKNETPSTETRLPLEAQNSASPVAVVAEATTPAETEAPTETTSTQTKKDTETMTKDQDNKTAEAEAKKSVDIPQTTTSSPFQRPANTATTAQGKSYGSYNPTPYGASATPSAGGSGNGRRLVIGEGITMSGEIESCDHLLVEGSVEAALKGAKVLELSETGKFYGTVEIEEATVSGHFEGELNVSGRLVVASTGVITGSIAYGELQIEAGATLDGRISPIGAAVAKKGKGKAAAAKKSDAELPLAS